MVDYGTGLKMLGNTLVFDKSVLPDVPALDEIWGKNINSTLEFSEDGETLGVNLVNIASEGLEKSGEGLQVLLGTEAPVKATCGGLGFTNAGGLSIALGNEVFKLGPTGLGISTSDTVTDAGGRLAVRYGRGLTSDIQQGLRVDVGSLVSGGRGLQYNNDGTMGVNVGAGLKIETCAVVVDYGTGLTTNSYGGLIVDAAKLTVGNAEKLAGNGIGNFMTFANVGGNYVTANFQDSTLSKVASEKYIEFWDGAGGWFNLQIGKLTTVYGIVGNLTGTASKATADSHGNNIAATYAKNFIPTNGLTINNDRILCLPNLTASLINGAVDGSRNGAQRVLNLSCGAIEIKLSTGLAIDDNGYLYIQDKYVTK